MSSLIRTRTGSFELERAVTVEELEGMSEEERVALLTPVEALFEELPVMNVADFYAKLLRGGASLYQKKVKFSLPAGQLCRVRQRGEFIALGRGDVVDGEPVIKQEKLFVIDPPAPPHSSRSVEKE